MAGLTLGIEGGGSKTQAVLVEAGKILVEDTFPPSNLTRTSPAEFAGLLYQISAQLGVKPNETAVVAGFAGAGASIYRARAENAFSELGYPKSETLVTTDAGLGLLTVGNQGIILIAGTGSICLGRNINREVRTGGNGYLIDQETSGYYLGKRLLNAILNADGRTARPSIMAAEVLETFGRNQARDLIQDIYSAETPKEKIAKLAIIVCKYAAVGDPQALELINEAVLDMFESINRVRINAKLPKGFTLALRGGIFKDPNIDRLILAPLKAKLATTCGDVQILMLERQDQPNFTLLKAIEAVKKVGGTSFSQIQVRDTEALSKTSLDMDLKNEAGLLELFYSSNLKVLAALKEPSLSVELDRIYERVKSQSDTQIIIAGAGTSGRLALILSRFYNNIPDAKITGWLAGGESALEKAKEGSEDDSMTAYTDIAKVIADNPQNSLVIAVSCGLSAPCVAGALLAARDSGKNTGLAVFGMTPLASARQDVAPRSGISCAAVLEDLVNFEADRFHPLIVLAGPEDLQGSTRLKGGTATWLTLNSLLHGIKENRKPSEVLNEEIVRLEQRTFDEKLESIIPVAISSISSGHNIYYIASDPELLAACKQDSAEIPPTFGVKAERVTTIDPKLQAEKLKLITKNDVVIIVGKSSSDVELPDAHVFTINPASFIEAKLDLNAISTAVFTKSGYVIGNEMINVQINNSKLFDRAVGIISRLAKVDSEQARTSLVSSLLNKEELSADDLAMSKGDFGKYTRDGVVPLAIVHAAGMSLQQGLALRNEGKSWSDVIREIWKK